MAPFMLVSHMEWVNEVCAKIEINHSSMVERERVKTTSQQFDIDYLVSKADMDGERNIAEVLNLCNNQSDYEPTLFQRNFTKAIVECLAPTIFGNKSANVLSLYLKKYGMKNVENKFVFAGTSRRMGKTDALTRLTAALLIVVPNIKILYYSIYERTCEVACDTVRKWIKSWRPHIRYAKENKLEIGIQGEELTDVRTVIFLNGQSANVKKNILSLFLFSFFSIFYLLVNACTPPPPPPTVFLR